MYEIIFFKNENGNEPVKKWLKSLDKFERKIIGNDILTVQYSYHLKIPVGMPLIKPIGDGFLEIRSYIKERITRIIFFIWNDKIIIVDGFVKKTEKIPKTHINLIKKRRDLFLKSIKCQK